MVGLYIDVLPGLTFILQRWEMNCACIMVNSDKVSLFYPSKNNTFEIHKYNTLVSLDYMIRRDCAIIRYISFHTNINRKVCL
jgi:hypothetical protein